MYNVTDFIEEMEKRKSKETLTPYDIMEIVKNDEKLLSILCAAVMNTYDNMKHAREFLK